MAFVSDTLRPRLRAASTIRARAGWGMLLAGAAVLLSGCSDLADPRDYGGGAEGQAIAQCVERTEDDNSSLTREEAGKLCSCLTERIAEGTEDPISNGSVNRAETQRALMRCAADLDIAVG